MTAHLLRRSATIAALAATIGESQAPPAEALAFVDVTVMTMQRGAAPLTRQTVLVRNGVIERIGDATAVAVPAGTRRIPMPAGAVLMPGLTDAHVHLEAQPERWFGLFLAYGVTTVFNLRGGPEHLALRQRVADGDVAGPNILTSGSYANIPMIQSPEDADSLVRAQRAAGYDFVKVHGNLSERAYAALQAASLRERIPIVGHAPRNLPFDSVLTATAHRNVAHAEEILYTHFSRDRDSARVNDVARRMAARGLWLTPTIAVYGAIATQIGRPATIDSAFSAAPYGLPVALQAYWRAGAYTNRELSTAPGYARNAAFLHDLTAAAWRAGVPLLTGTDSPLPLMWPGSSLIDEMDALVRTGLPRETVIAAATSQAGEFAQAYAPRGGRFGVIAEGARADLILISALPTVSFDVLRRPIGVAAGGRWYDRARLDAMVAAAASQ